MYRQALQLMRVGNELSVLSVGCGALLDYRGLQMALGDVGLRIHYHGIDQVNWNYKPEEVDGMVFSTTGA